MLVLLCTNVASVEDRSPVYIELEEAETEEIGVGVREGLRGREPGGARVGS